MNDVPSADLRSFALVGHASAGKTLLAEAMLVCAGRLGRPGSIAAGTTVSDYHPSEREHQMSVHCSLLHVPWLGRHLNILDTPGSADFISEGLGALRVGDFAVIVVNAAQGLGTGTDAAWDYATRFGLPKFIVINGLDKANTRLEPVLEAVREHFGRNVLPITLPLDPGPGFSQVLDVMRNEVTTYVPGGDGRYTEAPPGPHAERVKELHRELIEHVAESDDRLLERFFAQGVLAEEELRAGLHRAVQAQTVVPLFAVSAETNVGVARLLDFIAKYGSSPGDRASVPAQDAAGLPGEVALDQPDPVAFVFQTMNEPGVGELSLFRVYAGTVGTGDELLNANRQVKERLGQIYRLNGRERVPVARLHAGDLGALVRLRHTQTGDTLCSPRRPVVLPPVEHPRPNLHAALRLGSPGEEDKLAVGLATLHLEDPTFLHRVDDEVRQTVVSGQGELHLQVIVERLRRRFGVAVVLEEPLVPYRETVRAAGVSRYRHRKQTGGAGQFAEVALRVEPGPRASGLTFTQSLVGNAVDRGFVPSVEKGVRTAGLEGVLAGYRLTDVRTDFQDGRMHPVDSKDIAFQIAGYHAFKEACRAAQPCLLEPIHATRVTVPGEYVGAILGDLSARRGQILGVEADGHFQVVRARVPQKELHHYGTVVRSLTAGRGRHTEEFEHYAEVPPQLAERIIAERRRERDGAAA